MMDYFDLFLESGRMQLRTKYLGPESSSPNAEWIEYDTAQCAAEQAFAKIAHCTGRTRDSEPYEPDMVEAFNGKHLRLDISGHPREIAVAALHLHVRYGIDLPSPPKAGEDSGETQTQTGGVHLNPIEDAMDGYATFRFDGDQRPLEVLRHMLDEWMHLAERIPRIQEKARESHPRWREILGMEGVEGKPFRVVVTGVTGAGKSTFINGLLGRDIVPHSSEVCTAAVLHLRYPPDGKTESIRVHWRSRDDLQKLETDLLNKKRDLQEDLEKFRDNDHERDEKNLPSGLLENLRAKIISKFGDPKRRIGLADWVLDIQKELGDCEQRIAALAKTKEYWNQCQPTDTELSKLNDFAKAGPECAAEATSKIEIFIRHPLLKLVEIVDAPGLRDGNDERQKMLLSALVGDTAWLYLVPYNNNANFPQEDWNYIQTHVNNGSGILALTMADTHHPNKGETLEQAMRNKARFYVESLQWDRPVVWCSALLTGRMSKITQESMTEDCEAGVFTPITQLLDFGRSQKRCLLRFDEYLSASAAKCSESFEIARDYIFDSSRLPAVMRRVGGVLFKDSIENKLTQGHSEMIAAVQEASGFCTDSIETAGRILLAHDAVYELEMQLRELRNKISQGAGELSVFIEQSRHAKEKTYTEVVSLKYALIAHIKSRQERLDKKRFEKKYKKAMEFCLCGDFSFSIDDYLLTDEFLEDKNKKIKQLSFTTSRCLEFLQNPQTHVENVNKMLSQIFNTFPPPKTIRKREKFFEFSSSAVRRIWKKTDKELEEYVRLFQAVVSRSVSEFDKYVDGILNQKKFSLEQDIKSLEDRAEAVQRQIRENNPQQTRRKAEEDMASYREHQAAFEKFLKDLQQAVPSLG
jgi:hypothetical protein